MERVINKTTLPAGARIISERLPNAYSVTVGLWVTVGARDEALPLTGISHFLEHMAFKGTAKRSGLEIARQIDRLGGLANAFTGKETTCFHARALQEHLPLLCDLLSDIALRPALDQEEIERERSVILQEIMSMEDTPDDLVHVLFADHIWRDHPLGRSILGSSDSIDRLDSQALCSFLASHYQPANIIITAAGQVEHNRLLELAGPIFDAAAGSKKTTDARRQPVARAGFKVVERDLEQEHIVIGMPAPPAGDPLRFQASLLNLILGGNMSSRLFQEVREKRGLAYAVYSFMSNYSDCGLLEIYLGVAPDRAQEAVKVVRDELSHMAEKPVASGELADAKESLKGSIMLSLENPDSRMSRLARNEITFGRDISLEEILGQLEAVTVDDLQKLAQKLFAAEAQAGLALGPASKVWLT